ncbi:MAG: hypothetical protein RL693_924, partial [Verrucomicrobiota bacterium]
TVPTDEDFESRMREAIQEQPRPFVAAWWRSFAALAACGSVVFAGLWLMSSLRAPVVKATTQERLAVAVRVDEVKWESGQTNAPQAGAAVTAGSLRFKSGKLTLAFLSGVSVHIEGPADVNLLGPDRMVCKQGNIRTLVSEGAEGFTIETPGAAVVDLGTEFGVKVDPEGRSQVVVYQGKAETSLLSPDGSPRHTRLLGVQESVELDPRTSSMRNIAPRELLAAPDLKIAPLKLTKDYATRVLAAKPRHYWRGSAMTNDGRIEDTAPGAQPLRITGSVVPQADGSFDFAPTTEPQFLRADGDWTLPEEFAVELWFASQSFHSSDLAVMHSILDPRKVLALVELTRRDVRNPLRPGGVRFLYRWPPGGSDGVNLYSAPLYVPYQWHHLVCQRRGSVLEMYLDGQQVGETPLQGAELTTACVIRFGRLFEDPASKEHRQFQGRMAEMAIYERALDAKEIQDHARGGGR